MVNLLANKLHLEYTRGMKCARPTSAQKSRARSPESLLTQKGLRRTQERTLVLRELERLKSPVTIEELYALVQADVNKVTLYRMMEQFAEADLVERVSHPDGIKRYEYQVDHHHHITCTRCASRGTVHISETGLIAHALKSAPTFSTITSHTVEFYGVCKRCVSSNSFDQ